MNHIIGTTTIYLGKELSFLHGHKLLICGIFKNAANSEGDYNILKTDTEIQKAGGVTSSDRVEVTPWIESQCRYSFVTSDPRAVDLACFQHLIQK